jgi:CheY-like chemotaxis protein
MTEKILFVDDEENVLASIKRELRKQFPIDTATSGIQALEILEKQGPFAVIVSDLQMPLMDGIQLLSKIAVLYPDTVRLMLTGKADLETAIEAVNTGRIFHFLTKPCSLPSLASSLNQALRQYQLVAAERDLLNKTLKGSIRMLTEMLSLANPRAFSSGYRVKDIVAMIARRMGLVPLWQYEIAALICQIGCIAIPADILDKVYAGKELSPEERKIFHDHPRIGSQIVARIPRLEGVAEMIAGQFGSDRQTEHEPAQTGIASGSRILRAALDYDRLMIQGKTHGEALAVLQLDPEKYGSDVLSLLEEIEVPYCLKKTTTRLPFDELVPGMIAAEDICAGNGTLIIPRGQEITWPLLQGLQNYIRHLGIREPIRVWDA